MKPQKPKPKPNHTLEKYLYKTIKKLPKTPSPTTASHSSTCNIIPPSKKHFVEFGKVSHLSPDAKAVLDKLNQYGNVEKKGMGGFEYDNPFL